MTSITWALALHRRLHANFPAFTYDEEAAEAWAEWVADLGDYSDLVARAARALIAENPRQLPNGAEIRRRFMREAGLLAPSWPVAHKLLGEAAAGKMPWRDLPGPVRALTPDDAHADYLKPVEERYATEATAHDARIMAEDGVEELVEAAEYLRLVRERVERLTLARQCQFVMALPIRASMSDEEADETIEAFKATGEELPALSGPVVDADEKWTPAPAVAKLIDSMHKRTLRSVGQGGAA